MTDDNTPNLRLLQLPPADELRGQLEQLKRNVPYFIEMYAVTAQLQRARYLALVKEGFSEAQSLELSRTLT